VAAGTANLSLRELAQRVWSKLYADDVTGLAAEMSYYFVLSIFPFLIFLAALVGTLPFTGAWDGVLTWIVLYFPRQSQELVLEIVLSLTQGRTGFLSIGLIGTTWAASSGLLSLMGALNVVYDVKETRSFLIRLGLALLMVFVLAALVLSTFGLLTAANRLDRGLAVCSMGLVTASALWLVTRWITSVILLGVSIAILDRTLPNLHSKWRQAMPGVAFVVLGWLLSTAGFNLYAQYLGTFNRTYGVLGVFVILMVWIYLSSLIILTGAEINSVLTRSATGNNAMAPTSIAIEPPAS
jgi:membrane protein